MAESHDPVTAIDRGSQPRFGVVGRADVVEHGQGPAGGAAMEGPRQRADGPAHGGGEIRAGGGDDARRERRRIEAVIDGQDLVLLDARAWRAVGSDPVTIHR